MAMEPKISIQQWEVRRGKHGIEVTPLFTPAPSTLPPEIVDAAAVAAMNVAKMERIRETCKHDEGINIHRGEEVCALCWICPIPTRTARPM